MAGPAIATKLTAREFEAQSADVDFCELERGEVVQLTAGGWDHSRICFRIARILGDWAEPGRHGRVLVGEAGIITQNNPDTVRGVDVAYYSYRRLPRGQEPQGFVTVVPTLAVEVVGKGQGWGKMVEKAGEYLAMGADRVWIINPGARTVHVFRPDAEPQRFGEADTLADEAVLPGFSCGVAAIFED